MRSAIIMAAGKGTRMKSDKPKVLHEILHEPMVGIVLSSLKEAGAQKIVTVVGFQHELVEERLKDQCLFALQEPQQGTGHAVMQARQLSEDTGLTLIASGDCPCVRSETYAMLYEEGEKADLTILTAVPDDARAYGRVIRNADGSVKKIVEFKDANEEERAVKEINTGIYVFNTEVLFKYLPEISDENAQHEYYLTDMVEILLKHGHSVRAAACEEWKEVQGVNSNLELSEASAYLQERINTAWMEQGVTLADPKTAYIGPYVRIGKDCTVYPDTFLYGHTVLEDGVTVLPCTVVCDSTVPVSKTVGPLANIMDK